MDITQIDMDRVTERVVAAGFAAYVEHRGVGVATVFASRTWQDEPVGTIRRPAVHPDSDDSGYPRCDAVAGPGWFEGPGFSLARAVAGDFFVSEDGEDVSYVNARSEDEAVEALLAILRK